MFKVLLGGSFVLALSNLISRLMWVYRDHLLASSFGSGETLDIYFAAFRIPDLIYSLLLFATITVSFMPRYLEIHKNQWKHHSDLLTSKVFNLLTLIVWGFCLLVYIFAPIVVSSYVYNFSDAAKEMTVILMRIMLLSPILFTISSVAIGYQNANNIFVTQALSPIFYNGWIILGVYASRYYWAVALGWWVVFWAFIQALIQIIWLMILNYKWSPILKIDQETINMAKTAIPRILSVWILQLSITVDTIIASSLSAWSIANLNFASNIASLPLGMIVASIAVTAFVKLSKEKDSSEVFLNILKNNLSKTYYYLLPFLTLIYALSSEIVNYLFVYGHFTTRDSQVTVDILGYLLLAVSFQWFVFLIGRAYFAHSNTITPLKSAVISMLINIITSVLLAKWFGVAWIAMWSAIWMLVYAVMLIRSCMLDFWNFLPEKEIVYYVFSSWAMLFVIEWIRSYVNVILPLKILTLGLIWSVVYLILNKFKVIHE